MTNKKKSTTPRRVVPLDLLSAQRKATEKCGNTAFCRMTAAGFFEVSVRTDDKKIIRLGNSWEEAIEASPQMNSAVGDRVIDLATGVVYTVHERFPTSIVFRDDHGSVARQIPILSFTQKNWARAATLDEITANWAAPPKASTVNSTNVSSLDEVVAAVQQLAALRYSPQEPTRTRIMLSFCEGKVSFGKNMLFQERCTYWEAVAYLGKGEFGVLQARGATPTLALESMLKVYVESAEEINERRDGLLQKARKIVKERAFINQVKPG